MFKRLHHQRIAEVLKKLNPNLLKNERCYFAGGTAIALKFGEFRESVDIDFMTSDISCYRSLRQQIRESNNLTPLLLGNEILEISGDVRTDQYGIRTKIKQGDSLIKFEIVLEGRISFETPQTHDTVMGISCLTLVDLAASKILANSDRGLDTATHTRDLIDLAMMELSLPQLQQALNKAEEAYGKSALDDLVKVLKKLENKPSLLEANMSKMLIDIPQAVIWQKIKRLKKIQRNK